MPVWSVTEIAEVAECVQTAILYRLTAVLMCAYRIAPIMGAGYHTIHHTTYQHNYGHYFIYIDKLFGTLEDPDDFARRQAGGKVQ